jgi:hypothetical protein
MIAARRELDRVADQIEQDLAQARAIGEDVAARRSSILSAMESPFSLAFQANRSTTAPTSSRRSTGGMRRPAVRPRYERSRARRRGSAARLPPRFPPYPKTSLRGIERSRAKHLQHADDAVHRRTDFMAHGGQELALRPRGRFGDFLGHGQLRRLQSSLGDIDPVAGELDGIADAPGHGVGRHPALR